MCFMQLKVCVLNIFLWPIHFLHDLCVLIPNVFWCFFGAIRLLICEWILFFDAFIVIFFAVTVKMTVNVKMKVMRHKKCHKAWSFCFIINYLKSYFKSDYESFGEKEF